MLNDIKPRTAALLISEPFMLDPNFKRSVVLLTEHGEEGTVGYVLNQKSNVMISDLISECRDVDFPVYFGGPVGTDSLHFIHRCYDRMLSGTPVGEDIFWGGDFELLKQLLAAGEVKQEEVRFFIGYSGWEQGQLEEEINHNSWLVTDRYKVDALFLEDEENLWKEVLLSMGPRYAHIVNFPDSPQWN